MLIAETKYQKFIIWIVSSIVLGSLPWFVNFLVQMIADKISYFSIFRVNDLMFFVIILSARTMLDLIVLKENKFNSIKILVWIFLLFIILIASLFLGISSFYIAMPPASGPFAPIQSRLISWGLILCLFAFITTTVFEIYNCFIDKSDYKQE